MRLTVLFSLLVSMLACGSTTTARSAAPVEPATPPVFAALAELERMMQRPLWPGFEPARTPFAVFDGQHTLLAQHPSPPVEFTSLSSRQGVWLSAGRHPAVTANSTVELGGVPTATVMAPARDITSSQFAGVILHELFHVYQRDRHPGWIANDADLFMYPVDEPSVLASRRLESIALRRALAASAEPLAACWTREAMRERERRFSILSPNMIDYERKNELNEGLATYIQHRAQMLPDSTAIPEQEFATDAVRERTYASGAALALLLDRFAPAWRETLAVADTLALDQMLAASLAVREAPATCGLTDDERRIIALRADRDVASLTRERAARRQAFLDAPGVRVRIVASAAPLFPRRFDPLNVLRLTPSETLHGRMLQLANASGSLEVLGRAALTESAGEHPIFNGVLTVLLTGFQAEPVLDDSAGVLSVRAEGFTARLTHASVTRSAREITITLGTAAPLPR